MEKPNTDIAMAMENANQLTDKQMWYFALAAVACCGKRAQMIGNHDIEEACASFAHAMHTIVDTPDVEDLTLQ